MKIPRKFCLVSLMLALCCLWIGEIGEAARAADAPFPPRGHDIFESIAVLKITMLPEYGGETFNIWVRDPATIVLRSDPHNDLNMADVSGPMGTGATGSPYDPGAGTSDIEIGFHPPLYEGGEVDEVHTEIAHLRLSQRPHRPGDEGWIIRAGDAATGRPRSLGEVESRDITAGEIGNGDKQGFPADSYFLVYFVAECEEYAGGDLTGIMLENRDPFLMEAKAIVDFPPYRDSYLHTWSVAGRVALYEVGGGPLVGWLSAGSHGVHDIEAGLAYPAPDFPVVFSVDESAEGLLQPEPLLPFGHQPPNDVYALGIAGLGNVPPSWGYQTEGELFQSSGHSGSPWETPADVTNVDRISATLGVWSAANIFTGPFAPNPGAPNPNPNPPTGPGTLGLVPGDNIISLSFGMDWGNVLIFSVDHDAVGAPATAVNYHAVMSPYNAATAGTPPPSNATGDPGNEAAGDLYFSARLGGFRAHIPPGFKIKEAALANSNVLAYDELFLGLQAPAGYAFALGAPEDDLDALECDSARTVDDDADGIPDSGKYVFFTISPSSPSIATIPATSCDILVSTYSAPPAFAPPTIYANGISDIGLLAGDVIDALVLCENDGSPNGIMEPGVDFALFSLAAGSPSLAVHSMYPGDVFFTDFTPPLDAYYTTHSMLGLLETDELNALDIALGGRCEHVLPWLDADGDSIHDACDICPTIFDPEQNDYNGDGVGDACDPKGPNAGQLAVELVSFTATLHDGYADIEWTTATEINCGGFYLYWSRSEDGEKFALNEELIHPRGSELEGATYSFTDDDITGGEIYYWLEDVMLEGLSGMNGPVLAENRDEDIPAVFRLAQNNPNPFNPVTEIRYDLPVDCKVSLVVYNVLGQKVATLVDGYQMAGSRVATWDSRSDSGMRVASGIYFYKLHAGTFVETRKMVLLR